jgi:uncharacterized membrane protein YfcA
MSTPARNGQGFVAGSLIGALGGLIGLGGAEFRLPVLVGVFRLGTLEAVILNAASLNDYPYGRFGREPARHPSITG